MKFSAGDYTAVDFVDPEGRVRTLRPSNGVFSTDDPSGIGALRGLDLTERTEAQVSAARARRTSSTRAEAGKTATRVVDASTGESDTRGPGAPADEPGVKEG